MINELERQYIDMKEIIDAWMVRAETAEADNAKLRTEIEALKVYRDGYDPNVKMPEDGVFVLVEYKSHGISFIHDFACWRADGWHSDIWDENGTEEAIGNVTRWWPFPLIVE